MKVTSEDLIQELKDTGSLADIIISQAEDEGPDFIEFKGFVEEYCEANEYDLEDPDNLESEYKEAFDALTGDNDSY